MQGVVCVKLNLRNGLAVLWGDGPHVVTGCCVKMLDWGVPPQGNGQLILVGLVVLREVGDVADVVTLPASTAKPAITAQSLGLEAWV